MRMKSKKQLTMALALTLALGGKCDGICGVYPESETDHQRRLGAERRTAHEKEHRHSG